MANTLQDKINFEAFSNLIRHRGSARAKEKLLRSCEDLSSSSSSIWDRKPIDFSPRLYQPKPPKRNSKEAMKPWKYGSKETTSKQESQEIEKPPLDLSAYLSEKSKIDWQQNDENSRTSFQGSFRLLTANRARIEASKTMGFREGLDQYKNPMPHDFRGLQNLYGMPEFKTRYEKDVYNIKFLSDNLDIITGLEMPTEMRHVDEGLQMGEHKKTPEPKFLPNLVLPKLPYPNRFYGYTRYRPENRSVQSAYWERVLPILNEKWKREKEQQPYEFI